MKICIEVLGGMVQNVFAIGPEAVEVTVCDLDVSDFADEADFKEADEAAIELDAFRSDPSCRRVW